MGLDTVALAMKAEVPEPTSLAVFGIGAVCIAGVRRRRKANRTTPR